MHKGFITKPNPNLLININNMPSFMKVFRRRQKLSRALHVTRRKAAGTAARCNDPRVSAFVQWCSRVGVRLHPKIRIGREGSCAEIGVVATEEIGEGETVACIPRSALISCANSIDVRQRLLRDDVTAKRLDNMSTWVPLLLALLAEHGLETSSRWHPYLQLVPNYGSAGPPMLWSESQRDTLLAGTSVLQSEHIDAENIACDYSHIVLPFMQRHEDLFQSRLHSLDLFKQLVAMVMSYSFSDEANSDILQRTVMVPFVDLLNHHSNHHVELSFREDHLELVAVRTIKKGEEVMNTYGPLPNACLMHKYGFSELTNPHDVAYITHGNLREAVAGSPTMRTRWRQLEKDGLVDAALMYCVNSVGRPDRKLVITLKMLHGGKLRYACLRRHLISELDREEEDGIVEEEDKDTKASEFSSLSPTETCFLRSVVLRAMEELPTNSERPHTQWTSDRERFASILCHGQHLCLKVLLDKL